MSDFAHRPRNYLEWNRAIARAFFNPTRAGQIVHLTIDEETLRIIGNYPSRDEAVANFTESVKAQLRVTGWNVDETLVLPSQPAWRDWVPKAIGLLAFQVLVGFKMIWDEDFTSRNYWGRLARELGEHDEEKPRGLSMKLHDELWRTVVGGWANSRFYRGGEWGQLYLPPDEPYASDRWVRLPLSHTLLRREDRYRLPQFFLDAGLQAGELVENDFLAQLLEKKPELMEGWLPHARRVLSDPHRREAALDQIAEDLQAWDGSLEGRETTSAQRLRMWLTISRRGPKWLLTGCGLIKKVGELSERTDAPLDRLLAGRDYVPVYSNLRMLSYDEMVPGYVEVRQLIPGSQVVLMGHEALLNALRLWSEGVTETWTSLSLPLPSGWKAARVSIGERLQPKPIWNELVACHSVRIGAVGGLKLSHNTWLEGSGPAIELFGDPLPECFWVDGLPFDYRGGPTPCALLDEAGDHCIWVPHRRRQARTIQVTQASLTECYTLPFWPLEGAWPGLARWEEADEEIYLRGNVLVGEVIPAPIEVPPPMVDLSPPELPASPADAEQPSAEEASPGRLAEATTEKLLIKLLLGLRRNAWLLSEEEWRACSLHQHPTLKALYPAALGRWKHLQGQQA